MRKQHILLVSSYYWPETSGNAPYATGLAEHLAETSNVRVVCGYPHYPEWRPQGRRLASAQLHNGVRISRRWHYVPRSQSALTRGAYELSLCAGGLTALPGTRPDAVIGISPSLAAVVLARVAAKMFRCPYGILFQDLQGLGAAQSGVAGGARIANVVGGIELRAARSADAVAVIASGFESYLTAHGVDPLKIHRVPNWSQATAPTATPDEVRQAHGWSTEDFVCIHAGNMGQKQGLENVLLAAAALNNPRVRIVLAGDGNARERLMAQAAELRLTNVEFAPPLPAGRYEALLSAADVLLVNQRASVGEMSLASKLTSYFAAGRPVVAAVAANSETAREIERSGAGLIVAAEDPTALASELDRMADLPPATRQALGGAGQQYASEHLSRASVMRGYDSFLRAIVERR